MLARSSSSRYFSPLAGRSATARHRILLISDEPPAPDSIAALLVRAGYLVFHLDHQTDPVPKILGLGPALVVVHLAAGTRDQDAWHRQLRHGGIGTPILVVSFGGCLADRIRGLKLGADNYLAGPFHNEELLACVQSLLRRGPGHAPLAAQLHFGAVLVDLPRMTATGPHGSLRLSRTECAILDLLAHASGQPVSRTHILQSLWGPVDPPASRTVDTHVWRLRKKIGDTGTEPRWIKNVPGVGYWLEPSEPVKCARVAAII